MSGDIPKNPPRCQARMIRLHAERNTVTMWLLPEEFQRISQLRKALTPHRRSRIIARLFGKD